MPKDSAWPYRGCPSRLTYDGAQTLRLDGLPEADAVHDFSEHENRVGTLVPTQLCKRSGGAQAIERLENSQRMSPRAISPTRPFDPSSLTSVTMLPTTLPKNGRLAPTSRDATIAKANNISPISVSDPIQPFTRLRASMSESP